MSKITILEYVAKDILTQGIQVERIETKQKDNLLYFVNQTKNLQNVDFFVRIYNVEGLIMKNYIIEITSLFPQNNEKKQELQTIFNLLTKNYALIKCKVFDENVNTELSIQINIPSENDWSSECFLELLNYFRVFVLFNIPILNDFLENKISFEEVLKKIQN
jgi:hypothetical protein